MDVLKTLHLAALNSGTCTGHDAWSNTTQNETLASVNPSNGEVIAKVAVSTATDYTQVIQAAELAFKTWRIVPAPKRGEFVRQLGMLLREYKDPLGSLVSLEMGKSKQEGDGEVQEMIDMADFAVGLSRQLYGHTMHSERLHHRMYEQWHPLGVVGVITAFNFPVAVWAWNAFIAAIAGNTVIWKPSLKTPLCAVAVQHLCNQVMHSFGVKGIFSLFTPSDTSLVEAFIDDQRVPLISFTGSTAIGRQVNQRVAARLGRCLLELGGNNAIIIDDSVNWELAIPAVVFGAVGTAGQRCTTTRRLFVQKQKMEEVCRRLTHAYAQITIGDPLDKKNLMGPLIDQAAVLAYQEALKQIGELGGSILFGGEVLQQKGFFVKPTLIVAENHWPVVQQETFSPILYIIPYDHLDSAIAAQNSVAYGLSSALFTNQLQAAEQFLSASGSDCGIANINIGTSGAEIGGAFGGEKDTGGGREAGSDAWKAYMRRQTNTINWGNSLPLAQGIQFDLSR